MTLSKVVLLLAFTLSVSSGVRAQIKVFCPPIRGGEKTGINFSGLRSSKMIAVGISASKSSGKTKFFGKVLVAKSLGEPIVGTIHSARVDEGGVLVCTYPLVNYRNKRLTLKTRKFRDYDCRVDDHFPPSVFICD